MNWIHCNRCYSLASSSSGLKFTFTSCAHLVCFTCLKQHMTDGHLKHCPICNKNAQFIEISNKMNPNLMAFFKNPKDIVAEYSSRIKKVMEFQQYQNQHLLKYYREKSLQAEQSVRSAMKKERVAAAERDHLKAELGRSREIATKYEKIVSEREKEIQYLKHHRGTSTSSRKCRFPSLNGNTPLDFLSFTECASSTPNCLETSRQMQNCVSDINNTSYAVECTDIESTFSHRNNHMENLLKTPEINESIMAGTLGRFRMPETPTIYGFREFQQTL